MNNKLWLEKMWTLLLEVKGDDQLYDGASEDWTKDLWGQPLGSVELKVGINSLVYFYHKPINHMY